MTGARNWSVRRFWLPAGLLRVWAPWGGAVSAQRSSACGFPTVQSVCDPAVNADLHKAFPGNADVALLLGILLILPAVLAIVLGLFRLTVRPAPLQIKVLEKEQQVAPDAMVNFRIRLSNRSGKRPVAVRLDSENLPTMWTASWSASKATQGGFVQELPVGDGKWMELSTKSKGANVATVEVALKAPPATEQEGPTEIPVTFVPWIGGRARKPRHNKLKIVVSSEPSEVEIIGVTHQPSRIVPGKPVRTTARINNRGKNVVAASRVALEINGSESDAKTVGELAPGAEQEVTFQWTPKAGENRVRLSVT